MKNIFSVFLKGIFVLAPIVLTIYIVYKVYEITDGLFRGFLERIGVYFPGMGVLITLGIIFVFGILASNWLTKKVIDFLDSLAQKTPLIGKIYGIIKDTIQSFSGDRNSFANMVVIDLPNEMKVLGFLTNEETSAFVPEGYVAVYLMQSMQWAGNLVLVPKDNIHKVEASADEALKFIASAGLIDKENNEGK